MDITINGLTKTKAECARSMGAEIHEHLDGTYSAEFRAWVLECTPHIVVVFRDIFSDRFLIDRDCFTTIEIV